MKLGWAFEELRSDAWVKEADQPRVSLMMLMEEECPSVSGKARTPERPLTYCTQDAPMGTTRIGQGIVPAEIKDSGMECQVLFSYTHRPDHH